MKFLAEDGTVFDFQDECEEYETKIAIEKMLVGKINHQQLYRLTGKPYLNFKIYKANDPQLLKEYYSEYSSDFSFSSVQE